MRYILWAPVVERLRGEGFRFSEEPGDLSAAVDVEEHICRGHVIMAYLSPAAGKRAEEIYPEMEADRLRQAALHPSSLALASQASLCRDWMSPAEDAAWQHLQSPQNG